MGVETFKCAQCGKPFQRYARGVKHPEKACCSNKCKTIFRKKPRRKPLPKDQLCTLNGKNPKKVLRRIILKAVENGTAAYIFSSTRKVKRRIEVGFKERVREDGARWDRDTFEMKRGVSRSSN